MILGNWRFTKPKTPNTSAIEEVIKEPKKTEIIYQSNCQTIKYICEFNPSTGKQIKSTNFQSDGRTEQRKIHL
ncbi:DUF2963 domain-containing protein [Candidatus Phytoplasma ziziphi]|uniref:DUF2963 domain-containing protein n=1 Tax=Candidatus Phytoplasma TaxID=33926 RepID=UPI0013751E32|nr:DUF2963 domain-containing protein [Candidatus Phytoplasma ziziphi]